MFRGTIADVVRTYGRHWWRFAIVQAAILLGMLVVVALVALAVQSTGSGLLAWLSEDAAATVTRVTGLVMGLVGVLAIVVIPVQLAGIIATATITDRAIAATGPRLHGLLMIPVARFLSLLGTIALVLVTAAVALVAAPIIVIVGLLGLAITGVIALARRRRTDAVSWWPAWRTWGFLAIPFAVLWRVASTAILAPVASILEPARPIRAIRVADDTVAGRRWLVIALWLVSLAVAVALVMAALWLGSLVLGEPGAALFSTLMQLVAFPIPTVVTVALYRRAAGPGGRVLGGARAATRTRARAAVSPVLPRIASATVAILVLSVGLVAGPVVADAASADPGAVTYLVTSSADSLDEPTIDAQSASCLSVGPDCTIRAALALAARAAAGGAASATITFASGMQIDLADTLRFEPDWVSVEAPPEGGEGESGGGGGQSVPSDIVQGALVIDTGGQQVVLDGGDAVQILYVASEYWNLGISGLTFRHGRASNNYAGALLAGVPHTELQASVFDSNTATLGAGAIFARELVVYASSFVDNHASGTSASTLGGAIRAAGRVTVENSTFGGNHLGDQASPGTDQGIDIYTDAGVDVVNSSFVNAQGGAIATPQGTSSTVRNSIFTTDWTRGGVACGGGGDYTGAQNISGEGDTTCPGTVQGQHSLVSARDDAGRVPVYPLTVIANPAMGAGVDCPSVDALGAARPADGCDLGAVEFGATRLDLVAQPDQDTYGTVTFVATVVATSPSAAGAYLTGAVRFTVEGVAYDPIDVDPTGIASLEVARLGGDIEYSAEYVPGAPFDASTAGPLTYTVDQVAVPVSLECADDSAPECDGDWGITTTESIDLVATVDDEGRAGTIILASDADGHTPLASPVAVADGAARFSLDGSVLGLGSHPIYAIYESDDVRYAGVAAMRSLLVRLEPAVVLTGATGGVFGDSAAGTVTVTVTGASGVATGSVTVLNHTATLVDGTATIDVSRNPVSAGATALVAEYSGDPTYGRGASNTVTFTTSMAGTSTAIVGFSPQAPQFGEDVTVTVTVDAAHPSTADPEGSLLLSVGDESYVGVPDDSDGLDEGTRTFTVAIPTAELATGTRSIHAQFTGGGSFESSTSTTSALGVVPAVTSTVLDLAPATSAWGDQVTLTAVVDAAATNAAPAGSVEFTTGTVTLGTATLSPCPGGIDGCAVATLTVASSAIGLGTVAVGASYSGASDFASSDAATVNSVVTGATPTVTVTGVGSLAYGNAGSYDITVVAGAITPPTGAIVTVTAVGPSGAPIPLGVVSLSAGVATISVPTTNLLPGSYSIVASFAGDDHFTAADGSAGLVVTAATTDLDFTALSDSTVPYGGAVQATFTVQNETGSRSPEGEVVISWGGHEVGRVTLSSANDTSTPGLRSVTTDATFAGASLYPDAFWLTATFEPAAGFASSQLTTGIPEERRLVTVTPLQAGVVVTTSAVLGLPLEATATVSILGDNPGITPGGSVVFVIVGSNGPAIADSGAIPVVDGRATLPANVLVNLPGTWTVRAIYSPPIDERQYLSTNPNNLGFASTSVSAGSAVVDVTAPAVVALGQPLTVSVVVRAGIVAEGTVRLQFAGDGNLAVSDEVPLVDGRAEITAPLSSLLAFGDHDFAVYYSSAGALDSIRSADFTVRIGETATAVVLDTPSRSIELYPGIVGATVEYSARVTAASAVPVGYVRFLRGTTPIGQVTVDSSGAANLAVTADVAWSGTITAEFVSADARVAGSSATLAHSWVIAPVAVALTGPTIGAIGSPASYTAVVQFDSQQFRYLPTRLRPLTAPSGAVTITDAAGAQCSALASPLLISAVGVWPAVYSTELSTASCALDFVTVGARTLTANYAGDGLYPHSSATTEATVARGVPTLTVNTPDGDSWKGLTTVPVTWEVAGPDSGTVTVKLGSAAVCTSSSLIGSCTASVPRFGPVGGEVFTVEYSGNSRWESATATHRGLIVACIPIADPTSNPAGTATVTLSPGPTCADATGYYTNDRVAITVNAVDGYQLGAITDRGVPFPSEQITYFPDKTAATLLAYPVLQIVDGQPRPFSISAATTANCVPVTFQVTGIADRLKALSMLLWATDSCGDTRTVTSDTTVTASLRVGSQVRVGYQGGLVPQRSTFYGWKGNTSPDRFASTATFTVAAHDNTFTAAFGPICYSGLPTLEQPIGGVLSTTLPASNCTDPRTGATGWSYGTPAGGQLLDNAGTARLFLDAWGGDTDRYVPGTATTSVDSAGLSTTTRPFSFRITDADFGISATYGECFAVATKVIGDTTDGIPGTVSVSTAPNCPIAKGNSEETERWFRAGTAVTVTTAATGTTLKFLGWSGLPIARARLIDPTVTTVLTADVTATAAYGSNGNCRPFTVTTVPAGQIILDTQFTLGENACASRYGPTFYDQGVDGNGVIMNASPATPDAEGAEFVYAWSTSPVGAPAGASPSIGNIWTRSSQLNEAFYGTSTVVAYACQFVAISANVYSPDGEYVQGASASNIDRASHSRLSDFVATEDANCATGADPRSGYGGYAWVVGTQLLPISVVDPRAYTLTGWSGDVTGTGETPDAAVSLTGIGNWGATDEYHRRITASYTAICYHFTVAAGDQVEVLTDPNCPGVDPSESMYLGGTDVVMHATDSDSIRFRYWNVATEYIAAPDYVDPTDSRWASVTMTSDKLVAPQYTPPTLGENATKVGDAVGNQLAIASKKLVGVASAAASAYMKAMFLEVTTVAAGIGYLADGLNAVGVHGSVVDGMKNVSTAMGNMIGLLWAPMDCITAWSSGGEDTAIFAAQNFIATQLVDRLSAAPPKPAELGATSLQQLIAKAEQLKDRADPLITAGKSVLAAKSIYDAAGSGGIGWESSAYEAWVSQASYAVYTECMAGKAGAAMDSVDAAAP